MRVKLLADRVYRPEEQIRWRGKKIGVVVDFEESFSQPSHAVVEMAIRTAREIERVRATRLILDRGNVVEVYKKGN